MSELASSEINKEKQDNAQIPKDVQPLVPENENVQEEQKPKHSQMNNYDYYHVIPYISNYYDIVNLLQVSKRVTRSINTLPYYCYSTKHTTLLFPNLISGYFNTNQSNYFTDRFLLITKDLKYIHFHIDEKNKYLFDGNNKRYEKAKELLKNKHVSIELNVYFPEFFDIFENDFNIEYMKFTFTNKIKKTTLNTSIKKFDITFKRVIDINVFMNFIQHFNLKQLIIRLDCICQWSYVRKICSIISDEKINSIVYISERVIRESSGIGELLAGIDRSICIVFENICFIKNGKSYPIGEVKKNGCLIISDTKERVVITKPLVDVEFTDKQISEELEKRSDSFIRSSSVGLSSVGDGSNGKSTLRSSTKGNLNESTNKEELQESKFKIVKKIIDLRKSKSVRNVKTYYDLDKILLPSEVESLHVYTVPPTELPLNIIQLKVSKVITGLIDLSNTNIHRFVMKNSYCDEIRLPTTLTSLSVCDTKTKKFSVFGKLQEGVFKRNELPSLLLPTTVTSLNICKTKLSIIHLAHLRELKLKYADFSKLSTIDRFQKLSALTFVSKETPSTTSSTELPSLSFSSELENLTLKGVAFCKLSAPKLKILKVDFKQPKLCIPLTPSSAYGGQDNVRSANVEEYIEVAPAINLPSLNYAHISGLKKIDTISANKIVIEGGKEIIIGSNCYSLKLYKCSGKISFSDSKNISSIVSLQLCDCKYENNNLPAFKYLKRLEINLENEYDMYEWNFLNYTLLEELKITCAQFILDTLEIPRSLTSLCICSEEIANDLKPEVVKQLKVISIN